MFCSICGMEIREQSILVNNSALLNPNTLEDLKCCPFCGAPKTYLSDKLRNNFRVELSDEETIILDHAMKLEVFNGDFYRKAAKLAKNIEISEMFKVLSSIELVHASIHKRLGGFDKLPELVSLDYNKYDSDSLLLNLAKQREEHAVHFYNKYAAAMKDEFVKTVFTALSTVEKEHIILVGNN